MKKIITYLKSHFTKAEFVSMMHTFMANAAVEAGQYWSLVMQGDVTGVVLWSTGGALLRSFIKAVWKVAAPKYVDSHIISFIQTFVSHLSIEIAQQWYLVTSTGLSKVTAYALIVATLRALFKALYLNSRQVEIVDAITDKKDETTNN
jgi:hypothetical protein